MVAQQAIHDIMLRSEANIQSDQDFVVAVIGDLLKGFEKVDHLKLIVQAKKYRFPLYILRLALSMYSGMRRIMSGALASRAVVAMLGVTAGCTMAMFLLGLMLLEPFDDFTVDMKEWPVELSSYVDDFVVEVDFTKDHWKFMTLRDTANLAATAYVNLKGKLRKAGLIVAQEKQHAVATTNELAQEVASLIGDGCVTAMP